MSRGNVLEDASVAVNVWNVKQAQDIRLFFLSHYHEDHLEGLTPSWSSPIFMSNISAMLLKSRHQFLSSLIRPLDFGTPHILPPNFEDYYVVVTLIDANHCPGSTMYLFEGSFGTILYTGEFRSYPSLMPQIELCARSVDLLYFDNTYCWPKCQFPVETVISDEVVEFFLQLIGKARIMIGCDLVGKEEILARIYDKTKLKFTVNEVKMQVLELLNMGFMANTKCDRAESGLFLIDNCEINGKNIKKWSSEMPTQIILLTAKYVGAAVRPFRKHKNVHVFPYSRHSSFDELVAFVKEIRPQVIIPVIEQPLKSMFDTGQGSLESMQTLIDHVTSEMDEAHRKYMKNCLLKFSHRLETTKEGETTSNDNGTNEEKLPTDSSSSKNKVNNELHKKSLAAECTVNKYNDKNDNLFKSAEGSIARNLFQVLPSGHVVKKLPDFPNDLNEYFCNSQLRCSKQLNKTNSQASSQHLPPDNLAPGSNLPDISNKPKFIRSRKPFPRYNYMPAIHIPDTLNLEDIPCSNTASTKVVKSHESSPPLRERIFKRRSSNKHCQPPQKIKSTDKLINAGEHSDVDDRGDHISKTPTLNPSLLPVHKIQNSLGCSTRDVFCHTSKKTMSMACNNIIKADETSFGDHSFKAPTLEINSQTASPLQKKRNSLDVFSHNTQKTKHSIYEKHRKADVDNCGDRTQAIKSQNQSPLRKKLNCLEASTRSVYCQSSLEMVPTHHFDTSKEANTSKSNLDSGTEYEAVIEDIPTAFLDLIRKCQKRKLRRCSKGKESSKAEISSFLNQEVLIIHNAKNSICKGYRVKNKKLVS